MNLKDLLSDYQKKMLRQTLYFLIEEYDDKILDFILNYMNVSKDIYNYETMNYIKEQIK